MEDAGGQRIRSWEEQIPGTLPITGCDYVRTIRQCLYLQPAINNNVQNTKKVNNCSYFLTFHIGQ